MRHPPQTVPVPYQNLPVTPGFWRLGWFGISVALPESWNLCFHKGNARQGALVFSDLQTLRFEIRWKTPRGLLGLARGNPAATLKQMTARISRRKLKGKLESTLERLQNGAVRIEQDGKQVVLVADARRCYELHWPHSAEHLECIVNDFLANTPPTAQADEWFWSVYGASGWVPADAKLKQARMLPGECQLSFLCQSKGSRGRVILAAHSLADRLLGGRSLRVWATAAIPEIRNNPGGHWVESDLVASYEFQNSPRRVLRMSAVGHRIDMAHDLSDNRICWSQRSGSVLHTQDPAT